MKHEVKDMTPQEIDAFLKSQRVGLLCLGGDKPYAVPLAYSYDANTLYLTMRPTGRKMDSISRNRNACFVVYWMPPDFSMTKMTWKSVICEGMLEHLTDRAEITTAVRVGEQQMGMPAGSWDRLIESTMQNPASSGFWKINIRSVSGKYM